MNVFFALVSNGVNPEERQTMNVKKTFVTMASWLLAAYVSCAQDAPAAPSSFVGVGVALSVQDNSYRIMSVIPDSPAAQAHLQPGSYIEMVNGVSTDGMKVPELLERIQGPEGSTVALELANPEKTATNTVVLTRETITVPTPPSPPASNP
jgi:C-terminal processing protease CtpA/Prc